MTGWHKDHSSPAQHIRATAEKKRKGGETAVRIEKISALVLHETHEWQVEEVMETLSE